MASMIHDPGKVGDLIVHLDDAPCHDLGAGTTIRLLRYSEETGVFVLWVHMDPGATFAPHWHLASGEYFVTKGELIYDVGSARTGTYGYEPIASRHALARCDVETEYLFIAHGAVAFLDDEGGVRFILNHEFMRDLANQRIVADISNDGLETGAPERVLTAA